MSRFVSVLVLFLAVSILTPSTVLMAQPQQQGQAMILPVDPDALVIETSSGSYNFSIEIADDPLERSAGLMFRTDMDDDHGMLFVFEREHRTSFWMKNTPMPLDLIFIDNGGRVVAIRWGEPFSTASIGPLSPARFVLELKAGTAQKIGMAEGDHVNHPRIDEIAGAD